MKLVRYGEEGAERPGILDDNAHVRDISSVTPDIDGAFLESERFGALKQQDISAFPVVDRPGRIAEPMAGVGKFIGVGLNYADHAAESGAAVPSEPVLFMKATSSITGPYDNVVLPRDSVKSDWEVELGIIIGKSARYVDEDKAMDYIAGFCVVNDVSEREYQLERQGQWTKGKGCDTFGPFGPWLVTPEEVGDCDNRGIWLELNGERVQNGTTDTMVYKVRHLVHYISRYMSLQPGDLITTGTPPGVGLGMKPPRFLKAGDVMRLGIDGLGEQQQTVVAGES